MSALTAVIGMRRYLAEHDASPVEAAAALRRTDADYAGADFQTGLDLLEHLPEEVDFREPGQAVRDILSFLIEGREPWWRRLFPLGRQLLANSLTKDELQTFRVAGLMEVPPTSDVVKWWDDMSASVRADTDEAASQKGREGELLTLAYERKRLAADGIPYEPKWVAIEDNTAGYDVLSFEKSEHGATNKLIEVKATTDAAPRMIISRGEWKQAYEFGQSYCFHVWALPSQTLRIMSVADVGAHVPQDAGSGTWLQIEIKL